MASGMTRASLFCVAFLAASVAFAGTPVGLMCELLELVREDASALGCTEDVNNALHILDRGTSAHRQLEVFNTQIENGASRREALNAVVDMLIADTAMGL